MLFCGQGENAPSDSLPSSDLPPPNIGSSSCQGGRTQIPFQGLSYGDHGDHAGFLVKHRSCCAAQVLSPGTDLLIRYSRASGWTSLYPISLFIGTGDLLEVSGRSLSPPYNGGRMR